MTRLPIPSFAAGELAPTMAGRVDMEKFQSGVSTMKNFMVHKHGGASNRPGLEFVDEVARLANGLGGGSTGIRLIPFEFSVTQTYVLEFTQYCMRVFKDGALVLNPLVDAARFQWTASGSGTNEYYLEAAGGGAPGVNCSADNEVYIDSVVATQGTAGSLSAGEWDWADNDALGFSTHYVRLSDGTDPDTKADGFVSAAYRETTNYTGAQLSEIRYAQTADTMYLAHPSVSPRTLTRTNHYVWTFAVLALAAGISAPAAPAIAVTGATGATRTINYKLSAISAYGEESQPSSASSAVVDDPWTAGQKVTLSWAASTGAVRYRVYKSSRGEYGLIGETSGISFVDDNVDPDTSTGYPDAAPIFGAAWSADDLPGAVGLFEQRLLLARTNNQPQTIFTSQTGLLSNFFTSYPMKDTDAIEATVNSRMMNEIKHLVPMRDVLVFTSGSEWIFTHGDNSDALTPTSIQYKIQSHWGCNDLRPIIVGNVVLFVTRSGDAIRELSYSLESDGFQGGEVTILANHLFRGYTVSDWAYAKTPDSIIWCVRDDGALLGFTYMREQQMWAWHRHETDGEFQGVAVISDADESDEVYFAVKRTIDGSDKYYIEKLHARPTSDDIEDYFHVDSGLTYDGAAATTISGLGHLEGEAVVALADGNVVTGLTVSSGAITLPFEAEKVHVGLAYTSDLETLQLDAGGELMGRKKSVSSITLRLYKTRGAWVGPDEDNLTEMKLRTDEVWGAPIALFTGDKDMVLTGKWSDTYKLFVRNTDPVPITVLALVPNVTVGR